MTTTVSIQIEGEDSRRALEEFARVVRSMGFVPYEDHYANRYHDLCEALRLQNISPQDVLEKAQEIRWKAIEAARVKAE